MATVPEEKRCTATKKDGERCGARKALGGELCAGHAGLGVAGDPTVSKLAAQRSAENRRAKVEARKKTAMDWLADALEEKGERIAEAAARLAENGDMRAAQFLFERVYGKPVERVQTEDVTDLDALTAEQRTALRRELAEQFPHLRAVS